MTEGGGLDPRRHAFRDDLADSRLKGRVSADRYVEAQRAAVTAPLLPCYGAPGALLRDTEFLYGEPVGLLDYADGWWWAQSLVDGYVGYIRAHVSHDLDRIADHRVAVPLALAFPSPNIKQAPSLRLPLGSRVAVEDGVVVGAGNRFRRLIEPGADEERYILAAHVAPEGDVAGDWVSVAETFIGAPYLFGGKSWCGIDCSALVQLALQVAGLQSPRDSDMQATELGQPLPDAAELTRGDLVFWAGHVGVMVDAERFLHANGHHMMTVVEPLADVVARLGGLGLNVTVRRRLDQTART